MAYQMLEEVTGIGKTITNRNKNSRVPFIVGHIEDEVSVSLRGHLKTGQRWSLQNRPTESGLGLGCFTPTPPVEASLFSCANSVDRI